MQKSKLAHIVLDGFWPYQVSVLADKASRYIMEVVQNESKLNASQWRVLAAVADSPGRTASEVTAMTPMDKTIVSRAVQSLLKDGHIMKSPMDDKRRQSLMLTPSGMDLYARIAAKLHKDMSLSMSDKSEQADLIKQLKLFIKKIEQLS